MFRRTIRSAALLVALFVSVSVATAATAPAATDITNQFTTAGLNLPGLQAVEVGGIVVLRGAGSPADAERAGQIARDLGYTRVANLIRVLDAADDAAIQRLAERELSRHRGLDGSSIRVKSEAGIVNLAGRVSQELQKDMAVALIRHIDGVRGVTSSLQR